LEVPVYEHLRRRAIEQTDPVSQSGSLQRDMLVDRLLAASPLLALGLALRNALAYVRGSLQGVGMQTSRLNNHEQYKPFTSSTKRHLCA